MSDRQLGIFPFSADATEAPNTDATVHSAPAESRNIDMPYPQRFVAPHENSGKIVKGTIGSTDYIYATKVAHGVLAGDS